MESYFRVIFITCMLTLFATIVYASSYTVTATDTITTDNQEWGSFQFTIIVDESGVWHIEDGLDLIGTYQSEPLENERRGHNYDILYVEDTQQISIDQYGNVVLSNQGGTYWYFRQSDGGVADASLTSQHFTYTVVANPVPIPGAVWLLGSGILGLAGIRIRSRKRQSPDRKKPVTVNR